MTITTEIEIAVLMWCVIFAVALCLTEDMKKQGKPLDYPGLSSMVFATFFTVVGMLIVDLSSKMSNWFTPL